MYVRYPKKYQVQLREQLHVKRKIKLLNVDGNPTSGVV